MQRRGKERGKERSMERFQVAVRRSRNRDAQNPKSHRNFCHRLARELYNWHTHAVQR